VAGFCGRKVLLETWLLSEQGHDRLAWLKLGWRIASGKPRARARPAFAAAIDAVAVAATPIHAKARPTDTKPLLTKASRLEIAQGRSQKIRRELRGRLSSNFLAKIFAGVDSGHDPLTPPFSRTGVAQVGSITN
jgi:hypothetical protein